MYVTATAYYQIEGSKIAGNLDLEKKSHGQSLEALGLCSAHYTEGD